MALPGQNLVGEDKAIRLLIGTTKGAFFLESDAKRQDWKLSEPLFLGNIIHHLIADPRNPEIMVMALKTGHLGPTIFYSKDAGKTWQESEQPPAFPQSDDNSGQSLKTVFWLSSGHSSEPGVWYAGTAPIGLFRSEDNGKSWAEVEGFNQHENYPLWQKCGDVPQVGQVVHSININPQDPQHIYLGISVAGVFESTNKGVDWQPLNQGCAADFLPPSEKPPEYGHDPHCMFLHPEEPSRLYQQNHCGIYRLDRPGNEWQRIGDNMPEEIGDVGFPVTLHPRDPDTLWVFPMDASEVWPRISPGGRPAVYCSQDGGESWKRQDQGLPGSNAWLTVKRQAMVADAYEEVGVYFGTTSGSIWASSDQGENWSEIARDLPHIYSLERVHGV